MSTCDFSFGAIILIEDTLHVVAFAIRTPVGLLRVVGFHGMLAFHFQGNDKIRTRILIGTRGLLDVARHVSCF